LSRPLSSLADEGEASQAELSRRTGIDPSDVVATLNDLSARGYVARTRDAADRRRNVVSLTRAGRAELRRVDSVVAEIQERFLAPLTATERRQLVQMLTKLTE
jgi:DNA-binding MarR family transcriptional regulator